LARMTEREPRGADHAGWRSKPQTEAEWRRAVRRVRGLRVRGVEGGFVPAWSRVTAEDPREFNERLEAELVRVMKGVG